MRWAKQVELSQEQWKAVSCPTSLFLQGRSGTGKTVVLVRRLLHRRREAEAGSNQRMPSQVFVTKSSMLLNEVVGQLDQAGCASLQASWPPKGTLCVTWEQLVKLLVQSSTGKTHLAVPARGACVDYQRFLYHYWPKLRARARQLPPLLVWAEFNNRLRSFASEWQSKSMTLKEYM